MFARCCGLGGSSNVPELIENMSVPGSDAGSEEDDRDFVNLEDDHFFDTDDFIPEPKARDRLIECSRTHPAKRKLWQVKDKEWVPVTVASLLVFFGILILMAAQKIRCWRLAWMESEGFNVPFIQDAMQKNRFDQIRRYLHFVDNTKLFPKGHPRWNPLQKTLPLIKKLLKVFRRGYVMGQYMSIDESMIKYKGKQIKFVQCMPAKPIKHGIKLFALCCAETGYVYGFWVYCGKENDDCSPAEIVSRLMAQDSAFLTNSSGRVLYTDNWYTSEETMEHVYGQYKMFLVGTVKLSKKKSRSSDDFLFHKLSGPAKRKVGKGWFRWAQKPITDAMGRIRYITQALTWMDRSQVAVLHNWLVGGPGDCQTMRYDKDAKKKMPVPTHPIIPNYIKYMRGVDMFDQSMNDYNTSQRSNRWYMRIFYYLLNAVLSNMQVVVR